MISAEHAKMKETKEALISFMKEQNYSVLKEVNDNQGYPVDVLFAKDTILPTLNIDAMPEQIPLMKPTFRVVSQPEIIENPG